VQPPNTPPNKSTIKSPVPEPKTALAVRLYIFYSAVIVLLAAYGNYAGWFPTYGIFSGENSMRSGYHGGGFFFGGGSGIHGK
jgi:hypothetical protein